MAEGSAILVGPSCFSAQKIESLSAMVDGPGSGDQNDPKVIVCDIDDNAGKQCHFRDEDECTYMPAAWDQYCAYEIDFIQTRYNDLVFLFDVIKTAYSENYKCDSFWLNHTTLWKLLYIYANDLKPVRRFHNDDGGVNEFRRSSFVARLIVKHRPIQIAELAIPDTKVVRDSLAMRINEHFAWHALAHFLNLRATLFERPDIKEMVRGLLFTFEHRDPQVELLVCVARLLSILNDTLPPKTA